MKELTQEMTVQEQQTAEKVASGTLPVLATPVLIAFMENTAMKLLTELPEGETSVGTAINMQHLKASAIGETIRCTARLVNVEGRKYSFEIEAYDSSNNLVGKGTHERFAVNSERFMSKLIK